MKRVKLRDDILSKMDFSRRYNINRVRIDKLIEDGDLKVERISGTDFIVISKDQTLIEIK